MALERLVKNDILPPLEFLDLEQCRECIKGKYVKKIKKEPRQIQFVESSTNSYLSVAEGFIKEREY